MTWRGQVVQLFLAPQAGAPMEERAELHLLAGVGVDGDRYGAGRGTYSHKPHPGRQVTLFELETLTALGRDYQLELSARETRRNILTRGVPLAHLVGEQFLVGELVLIGERLSEPCQYLADLLGKPVFKPLVHRGGLGCRVVRGGTVRPGDPVLGADSSGLPPGPGGARAGEPPR
jgi:MOSC domain-containing protein YiiM